MLQQQQQPSISQRRTPLTQQRSRFASNRKVHINNNNNTNSSLPTSKPQPDSQLHSSYTASRQIINNHMSNDFPQLGMSSSATLESAKNASPKTTAHKSQVASYATVLSTRKTPSVVVGRDLRTNEACKIQQPFSSTTNKRSIRFQHSVQQAMTENSRLHRSGKTHSNYSSTKSPSADINSSVNRSLNNKSIQSKSSIKCLDNSLDDDQSSFQYNAFCRDLNSALNDEQTPISSQAKQKRRRRSKKKLYTSTPRVVRSASTVERRFNAPIVINLFDLVQDSQKSEKGKTNTKKSTPHTQPAPSIEKREMIGKVRQTPKVKRPTPLKRALLTEREVRRVRRCSSVPDSLRLGVSERSDPVTPEITDVNMELMTPVLQTPSNRSVLSGSLVKNSEQEELVSELLHQLASFQDRAYVKYADSPFYRKRSRRLVCGFHETMKHLKLGHLCMVILARDLEGGVVRKLITLQDSPATPLASPPEEPNALSSILHQILDMACQSTPQTPVFISHTRRTLAKVCHKPHLVAVVGILSVAGAESVSNRLLSLKPIIDDPHNSVTPE